MIAESGAATVYHFLHKKSRANKALLLLFSATVIIGRIDRNQAKSECRLLSRCRFMMLFIPCKHGLKVG